MPTPTPPCPLLSADPATPPVPDCARGILAAAAECFAKSGFDSASIADIAEAAGVSKANVFHHFKSKEALHREVLREACQDHAEFAEALLARDDLGSVDKLRLLVQYDFEDAYAKPRDTELVIREVLNTGCCAGRDLVEPVFMRNFDAVVAIVRQGIARGTFRADLNAGAAALMMAGTFVMFFQNRHMLRRFLGMDRCPTPQECAAYVTATMLDGVLARPGAGRAAPVRSPARSPSASPSAVRRNSRPRSSP